MRTRVVLLVLPAAWLLAVGGCGSSGAVNTTTIPVKGRVTYKGQPLTQGTVLFEPEGAGKEARGEINPDGTYVLTTYKPGDGAVPGAHRVSINGATGKTRASRIPDKYGSYNTSKLEAEVTREKTEFPFDLQ
jgi:hypothetical protein